MSTQEAYTIAMARPDTKLAFAKDGTLDAEALQQNIDHYRDLVARAAKDHGARLVAFPQFALTGYAFVSPQDWVNASLDIDGPEIAAIADAARAANAYVVIQFAERHAAFPGRYFLSAAILTPEGKVGLAYRKHYTLSLRTSPNDVHDRFVETFGRDGFYPVLDTPIGRMGLVIGGEVHWPEATRSLALKGAEIIINPIAAAGHVDYMQRPGADASRSVRAFENLVYVAMVNQAGPDAAPPTIHDFNGAAIARPAGENGVFTLATIDLSQLRAARDKAAANFLAQIQPHIHDDPRDLPLYPRNVFADHAPETSDQLIAQGSESWKRLQKHWQG